MSLLDAGCGFQVNLKSIIANNEIGEILADIGEIKRRQSRQKTV